MPTINVMPTETLVFPLDERPRLRNVELMPIEDRGQRVIWLRDRSDAGLQRIGISEFAAQVLAQFDGHKTIADVGRFLQEQGVPIPEADLRVLLEQLDRAGYLEGPRARHRLAERMRQFQARPVRAARFAGGAYPDGPIELPEFLAAGYLHPDGPGALPQQRGTAPPPRGLIAPHIDPKRGAPNYSWGYKALAEAQPADLYVVLGTCHMGVKGFFAATRKSYDTPLGVVPTDAAFLDRLGQSWGRDLFEGEFSHESEHSIEFQTLYLRSLGLAGESAAPMVAIMCSSLRSKVPRGATPAEVPFVADFVGALRDTIREDGRRITLIAAVDLAHVGQEFDDPWLCTTEKMQWVHEGDEQMLELVRTGQAEEYYRQVLHDDDARRICGLTPLYLLTALMGNDGQPGELLRYQQWVAPDLTSSVTHASLLFR